MIKLYYHIYTSTNRNLAVMMVDQQIRRLRNARIIGNMQLNCVIVGQHHDIVEDLVRRYGCFNILEVCPHDEEEFCEARTLRYIWQDTKMDDGICFMHTKGIAYHSGEKRVHGFTMPRNLTAINSWRWGMEYYNLDLWSERIENLNKASDTEGINMYLDPFWHYNGNFWWAKGSHIRKLPDPTRMEGTMEQRLKPRAWLFYQRGHHGNYFQCLNYLRDDNLPGPFRTHEDDMMPHVLKERTRLTELKAALARNDSEAVQRLSI